ncbi:MAG: T9SS type A sorting domain-containing protein [Flavobacteriales bacterium]|nr:T9SS type A sorting domain-containing protein [Flavobacteriales bacterium]
MKILLTTFVLISSLIGFSQNYQPFGQNSSKRFFDVDSLTNDNYFFYNDYSTSSGDTTYFTQYRKLVHIQDYTEYCTFWGGASGLFLDTTWLGITIKWNNVTRELSLLNNHAEAINFDFNLPIGASAPFYSNGSIEYRIEHSATVLSSFYNITDSVQLFEIQAFDPGGTPIASALNGFEIKLSKNYGIMSFINCFEFPALEQKFMLKGNTFPDFGEYSLTNDLAYPWQTGDQLQYRNSRLGQGANQYNYQMLTVTDRVETADSVWIYLTSALIEPSPAFGGPFNHQRSAQPIIYRKGSFVTYLPTNRSNYEIPIYGPLVFRGEWTDTNFCGDSLKAVSSSGYFQYLCDVCQCYGQYDGHGSSTSSQTYLENFGVSSRRHEPYGYLMNGTGLGSLLIYADVNGVTCGNLWADLDELNTFNLELFPNPTNDLVTINSEFQMEEITIRDFSGRIVRELSNINQKETTLSLTDLQNGAYILEVKANNSAQKKTIFKH